MLIAAIRTGHVLAGKAVSYSEDDGRFWVTGVGEIAPQQLLDYDDKRLLEWPDLATREWALETAALAARKAAAAAASAATLAAAAAAAAALRERLAPPSVVYPPPPIPAGPPTPIAARVVQRGIPAKPPGFDLSKAGTRPARWVVWAEHVDEEPLVAGAAPASPPVAATAAASGQWLAAPPGTAPPAIATGATPLDTAAAPVVPERPSDMTGAVTPRRARRRALKVAEKRREMAGARFRILLYVLAAAAAAAALYFFQRGGF